jgi:hypothetical protein
MPNRRKPAAATQDSTTSGNLPEDFRPRHVDITGHGSAFLMTTFIFDRCCSIEIRG